MRTRSGDVTRKLSWRHWSRMTTNKQSGIIALVWAKQKEERDNEVTPLMVVARKNVAQISCGEAQRPCTMFRCDTKATNRKNLQLEQLSKNQGTKWLIYLWVNLTSVLNLEIELKIFLFLQIASVEGSFTYFLPPSHHVRLPPQQPRGVNSSLISLEQRFYKPVR